ncbi:Trypsin-1,Hypodermin-B [Lepeophtheirus salmonis]|uniref:Trypsin-1,Hypodermin-B n=1 Tax=Lepeophtheirus salmonis TaxID=72036 RepID=A0A7R8CXL4_LEPSM|nr:Trypsin-1,Hypodermin-B [Lepeophtheirus salmonis]CAF2961262.1 Trypsin-1,Hypodermin-B [Lepeophtheirus salmonis]
MVPLTTRSLECNELTMMTGVLKTTTTGGQQHLRCSFCYYYYCSEEEDEFRSPSIILDESLGHGTSSSDQTRKVQKKELEEDGYREARAIWFSLSSSNKKQCNGSVQKIFPGKSLMIKMSLVDHSTRLYFSKGLLMIGYKGAFSNYFCGSEKNVHLNLNGRDALLLMFYSHSKFKFTTENSPTKGFSCKVSCRSPYQMESIQSSTVPNRETTTTMIVDIPTTTVPTTTATITTKPVATTTVDFTTVTDSFNEETQRNCKCGISGCIGVEEARENSEPWCGGSVINDRYILTAAHCVVKKAANRVLVVLGQHDWMNPEENSTSYTVEKIIKHPRFDSRARFDYDYALLRLSRRIIFDKDNQVSPICIPKSFHPQMKNGAVTGWGVMDPNNPNVQASQLQEVSVDYVDFDHCGSSYGKSSITDTMICAAAPEADACFGDSGGPLAVNYFGRTYLEGVVSWGRSCASPLYPGVYAAVKKVTSWIEENTWDSVYCAGSPRDGHF